MVYSSVSIGVWLQRIIWCDCLKRLKACGTIKIRQWRGNRNRYWYRNEDVGLRWERWERARKRGLNKSSVIFGNQPKRRHNNTMHIREYRVETMCNEAQIKVMFSDWIHIVCNHVLFVCKFFSLSHDFRLFCEQFICDIILYVIILFLLLLHCIIIREQPQLSARNSNRLIWCE